MQIYGPAQLHGAQTISAPHAARVQTPPQTSSYTAVSDQLDISSEGHLLDLVGQLPEIRQDRVSQLKALIAEGGYETPDRLSVALDRLLDEIG